MRLHRFYISSRIVFSSSGDFDITDKELVHQWKHVFRYNVGSQVALFDGREMAEYVCMISSLRNLGATVSVVKKIDRTPDAPRRNIWLCVALIKKDNFEWIVQKATELGASRIVPIICEHSEKRKINSERIQKIAIEASEQSGRCDLPEIDETTSLVELFNSGRLPQDKVAFHPSGIPFLAYKTAVNPPSVAAFIGPEGGFSEKEIALFKSYNVPIVSLGDQILRTETAAIAVASLLLLL